MNKKLFLLITLAIVVVAFSGCASYGRVHGVGHGSGASMHAKNFKVVKRHITTTVECPYVLGGIPLGDIHLWSRAMDDIRKQANMTGKPYALVNMTWDRGWTLLKNIYHIDRLVLSCDVVEYTGLTKR
jgi:hypothetical protein